MDLALIVGIGLFLIVAYFVFREFFQRKKPSEKWFAPQEVRKSERPKAPLTGRCSFCEQHVTMPYKCKYCGKLFCDEHRLPENHDCAGIRGLRREKDR